MRLVLVTPFLETKGGMERVVLKIADHFDARIHCLSYDSQATFPEFKNLDIEVAKPGIFGKVPVARRLFGAIDAGSHFYNTKLEDYDLINAHQTPAEWIRNRNSPVLWYSHTPNREAFDLYEWRMKKRGLVSKAAFWVSIKAFKQLEFKTVPKIEYIFTNSKNSQGRIKKYLNRDSEILYPGVEIEKFKTRPSEQYFFYPSRIVPEKEIEYAIESFKLFVSKMPKNSNWKLVIAGALSTRPEHVAYYKRLVSMCDDSITIKTNQEDEELIDLYARSYSVLYTPVNEDYGLVPLEAMAASKPCIARNEGGPKETIIDGVDGFLINSTNEMAEKMKWLATNPDQCVKMGKAGRKKVETKFTWNAFLTRFEEKAKELIGQAEK